MSADVFSNLTALDDLIQLVYQGSSRFVLLSHVDDDSWTMHLGLAKDGRWWRGVWREQDVLDFLSSTPSPALVEALANRLVQNVVEGELFVANWRSGAPSGTEVSLTFNPTDEKPVGVTMMELTPEEAAAFAAKEFVSIALLAQSRKCRLNPSTYDAPSVPSGSLRTPNFQYHSLPYVIGRTARSKYTLARTDPDTSTSATEATPRKTNSKPVEDATPPGTRLNKSTLPARSREGPKALVHAGSSASSTPNGSSSQKKLQSHLSRSESASQLAPPPRPIVRKNKGPVAHPNKRVRKLQDVGFGSDDED